MEWFEVVGSRYADTLERITPGCLGLWNDEQTAAWKRIVDFVHTTTSAKFGLQLGHAGRKGSTRLAWEGIDQPLDDGNWPLISASALPYMTTSQVPRAMTKADMDRVKADFVTATKRAIEAGFDILELHCAHGYLLSCFLSPLTNRRTDEYGGSHENNARYPLEVFRAVRKASPATEPLPLPPAVETPVQEGAAAKPIVPMSASSAVAPEPSVPLPSLPPAMPLPGVITSGPTGAGEGSAEKPKP